MKTTTKKLLITAALLMPITAQATPSEEFWKLVNEVTTSALLCSATVETGQPDSIYCEEYTANSQHFRANSIRLATEGSIILTSDSARASIESMKSAIDRISDSGY